jgi:hypothetical protein
MMNEVAFYMSPFALVNARNQKSRTKNTKRNCLAPSQYPNHP